METIDNGLESSQCADEDGINADAQIFISFRFIWNDTKLWHQLQRVAPQKQYRTAQMK